MDQSGRRERGDARAVRPLVDKRTAGRQAAGEVDEQQAARIGVLDRRSKAQSRRCQTKRLAHEHRRGTRKDWIHMCSSLSGRLR